VTRLPRFSGAVAALSVLVFVAPAQSAGDKWRVSGQAGMYRVVTVGSAHARDVAVIDEAIRETCKGQAQFCFVLVFDDSVQAPRAMPMSDAHVKAQIASHSFNSKTGVRRTLYRCSIVPDKTRCFN
jgi:hypothetical protein